MIAIWKLEHAKKREKRSEFVSFSCFKVKREEYEIVCRWQKHYRQAKEVEEGEEEEVEERIVKYGSDIYWMRAGSHMSTYEE